MNPLKDYMLANKDALVADAESGSFPVFDKASIIILANLVTKARIKYNVAFSKRAISQIFSICSEYKEMRKFADETESLLSSKFSILSGKVRYKGFPDSVAFTDKNLLLADSVLYYMGLTDEPLFTDNSNVVTCPTEIATNTKPIKVIKSVFNGTEYVASQVINELIHNDIALSEDNQSLLVYLSYHYPQVYIPDYSTVKFQASIAGNIAGRIASGDRKLDSVNLINVNTILRVAIGITCIKNEDMQNDLKITKTRFKLTTSEKKQLLRLFEQSTSNYTEMSQYAEVWKDFYTNLSLSLNKYPKFKTIMKELYSKTLLGGPSALLEAAIRTKDTNKVIYYGKQYPTLFARNIIRLNDLGFFFPSDVYHEILAKVPIRVSLQVYNRIRNYQNNKLDYRLVSYNGGSYAIEEKNYKNTYLHYAQMGKLVANCVNTRISNRIVEFLDGYSKLHKGTFYLGGEYNQLVIPTSLKESNTHFKYTTPYTRKKLDIKGKGNVIRLYTYWENVELDSPIDVDLSATFYDKDFNKFTDISYDNPSETELGAVHSGDITNAPEGAVEAIDFNLDMARYMGIRYVAIMDNVYAGSSSFKNIGTVSFGVANYKGDLPLKDPNALKDVYGVNNNSNFSIMAVYDLESNELITVDSKVAQAPKEWGNNAYNVSEGVQAIAKWYATRDNATVGEFVSPIAIKGKEVPFTNELATALINNILEDEDNG